MTAKKCAFALFVAFSLALPCRAGLLLSEVVFNEVGSDVTGEWIEIFNTGPTTISLTGHKIGDEETQLGTTLTESMHLFPVGASIAPGELQIVAVSATRFNTVYGINPTYEVNSTNALVPDMLPYPAWDPDGGVINMSNTTDHAYLLGPADQILDRASWGNNNAFNPGLTVPVLDGQSYERKNSYIDTDTADDWQVVEGATAAERSTPFTANVPEPATIVIALGLVLASGWLAVGECFCDLDMNKRLRVKTAEPFSFSCSMGPWPERDCIDSSFRTGRGRMLRYAYGNNLWWTRNRSMSIQVILWSILAVVLVVALPIVLIWSMVDHFRGRGSERRGGGGLSAGVGAALQELDRLAARPSVEHQIEAERHTTKRQDDAGGE